VPTAIAAARSSPTIQPFGAMRSWPAQRSSVSQAAQPASVAGSCARSFAGDAAGALRSLADWYDERLRRAIS
jgi:hypothetical protein